jgi:hypothetical protein
MMPAQIVTATVAVARIPARNRITSAINPSLVRFARSSSIAIINAQAPRKFEESKRALVDLSSSIGRNPRGFKFHVFGNWASRTARANP